MKRKTGKRALHRLITLEVIMKSSMSVILLFTFATPSVAQNVEMGSTYAAFDSHVESVTTTWPDAATITERLPNDILVTSVYDAKGRQILQLHIDRWGNVEAQGLQLHEVIESTTRSANFLEITTDWASLQGYALARDLHRLPISEVPHLVWSGAFLRPESLLDEHDEQTFAQEIMQSIDTVETVFPEAIASSMAIQEVAAKPETSKGNEGTYATFSTNFIDRKSGESIGGALWFEKTRVYSWSFGDLTSGWVSDERVPGGIPFTPNLAWSNIQSYTFWKLHGEQESSRLFATKDTVGCTGLHWLDNTIFRPCCDDHDRCYEANGCTFRSWWFRGSWACVRCNVAVVGCFLTGGLFADSCKICCGEACPTECLRCRPRTGCPV